MATYTSEELSAIAEAPVSIGMAVAMADLGIVSTAIEAVALSKEIVGAANRLHFENVLPDFRQQLLSWCNRWSDLSNQFQPASGYELACFTINLAAGEYGKCAYKFQSVGSHIRREHAAQIAKTGAGVDLATRFGHYQCD